MKIPRTSIKLDKTGAAFRRKMLKEFEFDRFHDFRRLDLASSCLDFIKQSRTEIEKDGLFISDRFGVKKEHPAAKIEKEQKILFIRILRELNLDYQEPAENRPPRR